MSEQKRLYFQVTSDAEPYIDLSSALTAANRKQHHQVSRKGVPLCYDVTLTFIECAAATQLRDVVTLPNNWTVRNAVVKTSAAWKKQLKDAGIRMKDLSKYGRRLRIPFQSAQSSSGVGTMANTMHPFGWDITDNTDRELFEQYVTPAGDNVSYDIAGEFTRFAIPDKDGGDSVEMNLAMLGYSGAVVANNYFGVLDEYLGSRGGVIDEPASAQQTPDADNLLQTMFSSTQPSTDEVIEAVEDYQEFRPYADGELDATATPPTVSSLCTTASSNGKIYASADLAASSVPRSIRLQVPMGLMKIITSVNKDHFRVDVHSIYEM